MKKLTLVGLALATALATASVAKADTFDFSITGINDPSDSNGANGVGITGFVDMVGTMVSPGVYEITSGTITLDGGGATGFTYGTGTVITAADAGGIYESGPPTVYYPVGEANYGLTYDDLYYPNSSNLIDGIGGMAFQFADGIQAAIYFDGTDEVLLGYDTSADQSESGGYDPAGAADGYDITLTAVPEPSSLLMLGTGLLLLAGFLFKKSKPVTVKQNMNTAA